MAKNLDALTDAIIEAVSGEHPDDLKPFDMGIMGEGEERPGDPRLVWLWMPDGKQGHGYQMIYRIGEIIELRDAINRFLEKQDGSGNRPR